MANTVKRLFTESRADNITGEAAKAAYYFFLSLFPLILVLFALTGLVGGPATFDWIMARVTEQVPPETAGFLGGVVRDITSRPQAGVLGIGLLLTIWAASGGVAALADGLNTMYDVEESRSWWKKRLIALGLLLAGLVLLVGGAVAIVAGPAIIRSLGLGPVADVLRWPLAFALVVALLWMLYYFLPDRDQSEAKGKVLVGALVGAAVWLGATALFRLYVSNFGSYSATYGAVGAVIVLMLWLYLTGVAVLFGGEVASVLERRREPGRAAGRVRRAA